MSQGSTSEKIPTISLSFKNKASLYASYIPIFIKGGIFVPTNKTSIGLGSRFRLSLVLPDTDDKKEIVARVAWITPAGAENGRKEGLGLAFDTPDEEAMALNKHIGDLLESEVDLKSKKNASYTL